MGRCNGCQSAHCVLPLRLQVRHSFLDAGTFSCDCEPAEGSACSAACSRSCFLRSAAASAMSTGLHQIDPHKATCFCGAQGKSGCRMARPAGHPVEATRVLEIQHQVGCGPSNMLADCNAPRQCRVGCSQHAGSRLGTRRYGCAVGDIKVLLVWTMGRKLVSRGCGAGCLVGSPRAPGRLRSGCMPRVAIAAS